MLTKFIPILSKKEEIIALEGEIISNIVFVKDGKLSLEISIDINNPYKSIHKYLEINFIGISEKKELKENNPFNKVKIIVDLPDKNYNNLKERIDTFLYNKKNLINNSIMDNNGISVDLGRLDFSRDKIGQNQGEDFHVIKVLDIRKNEYFADVHMFLEKPIPFTIKAKSRIAELFLLRKSDAMNLSQNFSHIWRRIQNKSYHNLVSIKKLTFKILKQYYNTYCFSKNINDASYMLNFDVTRNFNSEISYSENRQIFANNRAINKTQNKSINKSFIKSINKSINSINKIKKKSNNLIRPEKIQLNHNKTNDKQKLLIGYNTMKKNNGDSTDNIHFSIDSIHSNSFQSSSDSKISNSSTNKQKKETVLIKNLNKEFEEENDKLYNLINKKNPSHNPTNKLHSYTDIKQFINKKSNDEITFKDDYISYKNSIISPQILLKLSHKFSSKSILSNLAKNNIYIKKQSRKTNNSDLINNNETIKFYSSKEDIKGKYNQNLDFVTLDDIDKKFSKRIKKIIKREKNLKN